jgi:hemerythrin superfamily protein
MTDVIGLLKADHKKVRALFKEAGELGDRAHTARANLFSEIAAALKLHTKAEETIFYPALKKKSKAGSDERDEVLEAYEEHAAAKALIGTIEQTDPKDETYKAKVQVLGEMIEHHVKEEEAEMFKQARSLLSEDELVELGEEIAAMKEVQTARV